MRNRKTITRLLGALMVGAGLFLVSASSATAEPPYNPATPPVLKLYSASNPTAIPGGQIRYLMQLNNIGGSDTPNSKEDAVKAKYTVKATLPPGLTGVSGASGNGWSCTVLPDSIECTNPGGTQTSRQIRAHHNQSMQQFVFTAAVSPTAAGETLTASFQAWGGGATLSGGGSCASSVTPPPTLPPCTTMLDATRISAETPQFGVAEFDGQTSANQAGNPFSQAGGHPYALSTSVEFDAFTHPNPFLGDLWPVEPTKDVFVDLPLGFVGNPTIAHRCATSELANPGSLAMEPLCSSSSQVGTISIRVNGSGGGYTIFGPIPVFNLIPPAGAPARFGFNVVGTVVVLDAMLRNTASGYGLGVDFRNISEGLAVQGSTLTFWGVPTDPSHTSERSCLGVASPWQGGPTCTNTAPPEPLFRMPTSCTEAGEGLEWRLSTDSWVNPGKLDENENPDLTDPAWKQASYSTHEPPAYPAASEDRGPELGTTGCGDIPVKAKLEAQPTSIDTETSSGLEVHVEIPNPGLENKDGIASSDIKGVKVTLPQGVTVNPSQAEGLGVCRPGQYESTELSFFPTPGKGCPDDAKIGTVQVKTPLLEETIPGDVYIAQQDDPSTTAKGAENPFDSLLALYIILREPERGILIKLAGKVETDESSGRIVTTFDDLPQLPFSSFDFKFREGARAPLVTPPTCGAYETEAEFTPWSDPSKKLISTSSFEIVHGIGGGPCPSAGIPPFHPGFSAGSLNNNAGSFSPFNMRLTRNDGEQNMTKFSSVLPPGVSAKIAGMEKCSEAAIAAAKGKTGREELAAPSCPANSQIGRSLAGAGVGSVLTYVPGKIYLAGPYNGAPISAVAITPAVAGPFDVGTVVVREALTLDPVTAVVHVDGDKSDPIPHILKGIPLKLRDLRVYADRPDFTINPTSCDPSQVGATLFGSYADVFSPADDAPVALSSRFQAANCSRLGFKPKLSIKLKGGTKRGGHPALRAVVTPRPGDANISDAVVKLPRSAFLDQAHIRTICTRVQFAADACPPGAIYGHVKAWTPLLDEPLEGPVYLRSSNHNLPDLVFDLHGVVDIEAAGRIDSVKGGIRTSFEAVPDAPVSRVILDMQGGRKGLIQNSRNLCHGRNRADVKFDGQNGKPRDFRPVVKPQCKMGRKGKK